MAENAGNLEVRLGANIRDFQRKMDAAQARMQRTADASKRLAGAVAGVGAAAGVAAGAAVRLAGRFEQAEIAFTTMLGSAREAKRFLGELADFASKTPFEFTGLQQSSRLLLAFGFEAERVLPIMQTLGDATSALGGSTAELNGVVRAIGQIQTKGKVSAEELLQLAERGIPAYEILADKLNLTAEEVADIGTMGIDASVAINALLEGMSDRFAGAMRDQSQSLLGLFSNVQDEVGLTMIALGQDIIDALNLKEVTANAIEALGRFRDRVEEVGLAGILEEWKNGLIVVASTIGAALLPALASLTIAAASAALALAPFLIGGAIAGGLFLLAQRFHDVAQNGQDFREEVDEGKDALDKFEESAKTAKTAVEKLTEATDEDGFLGAVTSLASTLNTDAGDALESFARAHGLPLIAQGELQDAIDVTLGKFAELRRGSLEAELTSAESLQATILNRLQLLQGDLTFFTEALEAAKAAGDQAGVIIATEEFERTQAQVESMTGQYLEQSRTISDLRAEIHELGEAQAVLNDETLTVEERLDKFLELLGFVPTATRKAAGAAEELGKRTETAGEKVRTAAEEVDDLTTSLEGLTEAQRRYNETHFAFRDRGGRATVADPNTHLARRRRENRERSNRFYNDEHFAFSPRQDPANLGRLVADAIINKAVEANRVAAEDWLERMEWQVGKFGRNFKDRVLEAAGAWAGFFEGWTARQARQLELAAHNARYTTGTQTFGGMGLIAAQREEDRVRFNRDLFQFRPRSGDGGAGELFNQGVTPFSNPSRGDGGSGNLAFNNRMGEIAVRGRREDGHQLGQARQINRERGIFTGPLEAAGEGLKQFGMALLESAASQVPGFGAALSAAAGGPVAMLAAFFADLAAQTESFQAIIEMAQKAMEPIINALDSLLSAVMPVVEPLLELNAVFAPFVEIIAKILTPVFKVLAVVLDVLVGAVQAVVNAFIDVYNFLLGWLFGEVERLERRDLGADDPPEERKSEGAAFGVGRSDPTYNPQIGLSVSRSSAAPSMSTAMINVADLFGVHVESFGAAVDKFVSGSNRFARTNGGL